MGYISITDKQTAYYEKHGYRVMKVDGVPCLQGDHGGVRGPHQGEDVPRGDPSGDSGARLPSQRDLSPHPYCVPGGYSRKNVTLKPKP